MIKTPDSKLISYVILEYIFYFVKGEIGVGYWGLVFEEATGVGTPVLEEGAGLVVDGGAKGFAGEEGVPEEFGEEGGAVDER